MDNEEINTKKVEKEKKKKKKKNQEEEEESEGSQEEEIKDNADRPDLIHDNFIILNEMGKGAFGQIYLTYNNRDQEEVALKKENKSIKQLVPHLRTEFLVLKSLLKISSTTTLPNSQEVLLDLSGKNRIQQEELPGFPKLYGFGEHSDFYYLIIQLLGPNLFELINYCGCKKFTITTTAMLAIQMLNRIESLHKHHYIYRDIKPENFLIGCGERSNIIYLIDYGLCKKYKDPRTNQHIAYRENRNLTGTARYVSINTHLGIEQSRRDDLESLGYVFVFFMKGILPWQGIKGNADKYNKIMEKKMQVPTEVLCFGLPEEMGQYLNYCKSLKFEDRPDYDYLRGLFVKLMYKCINVYSLSKENLKFDWCFEDPLQVWGLFRKKCIKAETPSKHNKNETPGKDNSSTNLMKENKYSSTAMPKIEEQRETLLENEKPTPLPAKSSEESVHQLSEATVVKDNIDIEVDLILEKETEGFSKPNAVVEDIDLYINKIKSKQVQMNKNIIDKSNDGSKTSEQTIELRSNNNNINVNLMDNTSNDNDNSVINFIKNTKKLNQAGTLDKKLNTYEKNMLEDPSSSNIAKINYTPDLGQIDYNKFTSMKYANKSIDNDSYDRNNTHENKERRKNKMVELTNNHNFNNNPILLKLSKDQMIKISNEPLTNHYIVLGDLGTGSYGIVKKVKHRKSNEERAMKIIKKKPDSYNEIDILKKISHPNIISIYEIFEDSKNYYIMTELIDGGELFEEITNRGSFSENDAAKILKQLLNAINYLHNKNIVHRDLKPENIMMINKNSSNFEIKVIDFGTAKIYDKNEKLTKFIGTSYYIAPEVLAENYDERCDIWSAGVILYILFCGYPPFNGASNLDIYHAIKYSSPSFAGEEWKDVSREAVDLIVNMLIKNPNKRLTAEQCINHPWFNKIESLEKEDENNIKFNPLKALNRMTRFVTENKLKQSVIQFISTQFNLKEEEVSLKNLFEQFDKEKKGYISNTTFHQVLSKYFGENEAKIFSEKIFSNLDNDGNGEISYNEFITSIIDKKVLEKNQRIEKAFKMMDKDNSGKISLEEIRYLFGGDIGKWKKIISGIDINGDNEIDFNEFKKMLGFFDETEINV